MAFLSSIVFPAWIGAKIYFGGLSLLCFDACCETVFTDNKVQIACDAIDGFSLDFSPCLHWSKDLFWEGVFPCRVFMPARKQHLQRMKRKLLAMHPLPLELVQRFILEGFLCFDAYGETIFTENDLRAFKVIQIDAKVTESGNCNNQYRPQRSI
ncbi:hypothetical protein CEXT_316161 [Caerostris extrusa]|uniref:Uncharacterized protein n=1 Tax=Caerostris extrusa TaxID=172846 RepID=A0AAV4ML50_CAEEX|nr:hypothetical protein CEXT_316161 [Caerostris extrusa]